MRADGPRHALVAVLALGWLGACAAEAPEPAARPARPAQTQSPADWAEGVDGFWSVDRRAARTLEERQAAAALEGIGYASGYEEAPPASGVTLFERERAQAGLNLYTSGHAAQANLIDMDGRVLHTWALAYEDIPGAPPSDSPMLTGAWRRVALLEDGSLLAIFEGLLLIKIDRDSRLLWQYDGKPHHDLEVQPDGSIYVLTRASVFRKGLHPNRPILEDFVAQLDAQGREQRRVSLIECFRHSEYRDMLEQRARPAGDIFHTNTVEVLDGRLAARLPAFRAGNVLLSMRHLNAIAVVDLDARSVVWAAQGPWVAQHQPTVLENGNLLLFDNLGWGGCSQVLELDPLSLEPLWAWRGDPPESFVSLYCGSSQRLAGGNTLISDSCSGRAFEVTPDGTPVWEFVSPHRAGEQGELIAALFEMVRFPEDALTWLAR